MKTIKEAVWGLFNTLLFASLSYIMFNIGKKIQHRDSESYVEFFRWTKKLQFSIAVLLISIYFLTALVFTASHLYFLSCLLLVIEGVVCFQFLTQIGLMQLEFKIWIGLVGAVFLLSFLYLLHLVKIICDSEITLSLYNLLSNELEGFETVIGMIEYLLIMSFSGIFIANSHMVIFETLIFGLACMLLVLFVNRVYKCLKYYQTLIINLNREGKNRKGNHFVIQVEDTDDIASMYYTLLQFLSQQISPVKIKKTNKRKETDFLIQIQNAFSVDGMSVFIGTPEILSLVESEVISNNITLAITLNPEKKTEKVIPKRHTNIAITKNDYYENEEYDFIFKLSDSYTDLSLSQKLNEARTKIINDYHIQQFVSYEIREIIPQSSYCRYLQNMITYNRSQYSNVEQFERYILSVESLFKYVSILAWTMNNKSVTEIVNDQELNSMGSWFNAFQKQVAILEDDICDYFINRKISQEDKRYIVITCLMKDVGLRGLKIRRMRDYWQALVSIRNRTMGHGAATYKISDDVIFLINRISIEDLSKVLSYALSHGEVSPRMVQLNWIINKNGLCYLFTGYFPKYQRFEYLEYLTNDIITA